MSFTGVLVMFFAGYGPAAISAELIATFTLKVQTCRINAWTERMAVCPLYADNSSANSEESEDLFKVSKTRGDGSIDLRQKVLAKLYEVKKYGEDNGQGAIIDLGSIWVHYGYVLYHGRICNPLKLVSTHRTIDKVINNPRNGVFLTNVFDAGKNG